MSGYLKRQSRDKGGPGGLVARVEAATDPERDRYLDFVRVAAILMVIVGHWVVRVVIAPEGEPEARYLLDIAPDWQWASLIWQVMPLIFLVGGTLNAKSWRRAQSEGMARMAWVQKRAIRLLRPATVLLVVLIPLWVLADFFVADALVIDPAIALIPLWFIAAYLAVMALTPVTLAVHEKDWSLPAIALAVALAGGTDALRWLGVGPIVGTQPLVGLPNFLLIWVAIHQLGHLWADDKLPKTPVGQLGLILAGVGGLYALIGMAGWPLTMVPVEGTDQPNNAAPPTVALFALAIVQTGLALMVQDSMRRVLGHPVFWTAIALLGARMMTLFLWHQVAMVVVANIALHMDWVPLTETVDARWWSQQPAWVLVFAIVLAGLVFAVGRFEQAEAPKSEDEQPNGPTILFGIGMAGSGIAGLLWLGVAEQPPSLALLFLALCLAGYGILGGKWRRLSR